MTIPGFWETCIDTVVQPDFYVAKEPIYKEQLLEKIERIFFNAIKSMANVFIALSRIPTTIIGIPAIATYYCFKTVIVRHNHNEQHPDKPYSLKAAYMDILITRSEQKQNQQKETLNTFQTRYDRILTQLQKNVHLAQQNTDFLVEALQKRMNEDQKIAPKPQQST